MGGLCCLLVGGFDHSISLEAQLHEQNAQSFVYQDERLEQSIEFHGGFYIVVFFW